MKICVLGLGYIGLPTAVVFASHGLHVHGVDIDSERVEKIRQKELFVDEPGLKEKMSAVLDSGNFTVSCEPVTANVFLLSVPTPVSQLSSANLEYVINAAEMIVPYLSKGNLVILESTVPPLTVKNVLVPILERSRYMIGEEVFVSYSAERVLPGNLLEEFANNDRVIAGVNELSSKLTAALYRLVVKGKIHITDTVTAEMVKLIENTFRDVNIALANDLARIAEEIGINIWEAIALANSHPRVNLHSPGPGVGGHCIPVDPWFLLQNASYKSRLIQEARQINDNMPYHVVNIIETLVKDIPNPLITVLGLAFKGNTSDVRESPAFVIINELIKKCYRLKLYDPYVKTDLKENAATLEEAVTQSDCIALLVDHDIFRFIDFKDIKSLVRTKNIFDARNLFNNVRLKSLGFKYRVLGAV
jgi:UDP-N-acetyl-D-mannosaminuronic acid dehydrogenase